MARLERVLRSGADEIANVSGQTFATMRALQLIWRGQVMEAFDSLWRSQHSVQLRAAESALRDAADTVARNLAAQVETSDTFASKGVSTAPNSGTSADRARSLGEPTRPSKGGDLDGTVSGQPRPEERRADFHSKPGDGSDAVIEALNHTANTSRLAKDEFEIVYLDNGKAIIVLPGVTDLSGTLEAAGNTVIDPKTGFPELVDEVGWDPENFTARDTWLAARRSLRTASVDDNVYAQLVEDYITEQIYAGNLERGVEVMIVGHSYGADTAIDLASDSHFNGDLVEVTHVVAAGYHSEPQLSSVVEGTQVAVLQNNADRVIAVEGLVSGDVDTALRPADSFLRRAGESVANSKIDAGNALADDAANVVESTTEYGLNGLGKFGNSLIIGDDPIPSVEFEYNVPDVGHVDLTSASVQQYNDNISVSQFHGGYDGQGHDQKVYTDYLRGDGGEHFEAFLSDVASSGYTGSGPAVAVDISVPEDKR